MTLCEHTYKPNYFSRSLHGGEVDADGVVSGHEYYTTPGHHYSQHQQDYIQY